MPTNGFSIKPQKLKLLAGEQKQPRYVGALQRPTNRGLPFFALGQGLALDSESEAEEMRVPQSKSHKIPWCLVGFKGFSFG